ncbi:type VI secretion system Vgr family protein [Chitinivorax sp. B]|uniref:type VI secretion system Vgr family protein n=1 Tax=Chitinivorax sp. B TaxID=2502235 RepID=UPI0010F7633E|nr:type VI secretion system Vgr family protein [Chitinivorax sp. B]
MSFSLPAIGSLVSPLLTAELDTLHQLLSRPELSQHARLIRIEGTPMPVVVERFVCWEGVNQLGRIEVDVLIDQLLIKPADWLGQELTLTLMDASGQPHARHGCVGSLHELGNDGGVGRLRLTLYPWFAWLASRHDCWLFQNKTVLDIVGEVLKDYPCANWQASVSQPLRTRSLCVQYQESDYAFLSRLLADEGLSFHFEHAADSSSERASAQTAQSPASQCSLRITDQHADWPDCTASPLRFGRVAATLADDRFTRFEATQRVAPASVVVSSWDYDQLHAPVGQAEATLLAGQQPLLQDYDGSGAYRFDDADHAQRIAQLRQLTHAARAQALTGEGAVRALRPGQQFELIEHATLNGRYRVLEIIHEGANNLNTGLRELFSSTGVERGSYRHQLVCLPATLPAMPAPLPKPTAYLQSAIVVGVADDTLTSDREHRVKLQFPWQRGERALAGGLAHPAGNNAPKNEQAITWVRVAEWLAGPNWGSQFTPRMGDEVMVDFIEGDPDRPVIIGSLYNEQDLPPFSAGVDASANHPGTLSGYHSRNLSGSGYNRWVLDDTPGQLRTQLASSQLASELNLGYLIQQPAHSGWRGAYRGSGFELRTDGWGTLRGHQGILLSTHARPQAGSTQLDTAETQATLTATETLLKQLDQTATTHHALPLTSRTSTERLHQQLGHYVGAVNGQPAQQPSDTDPSGRQLQDPVATFTAPITVLATPTSLVQTTAASQLTFAGQDLQAISHGEQHLTAHQTLGVTAGSTASLFTHHGGMKVIAAKAPVSIQAHDDTLHLVSEQALTLTSSQDEIRILAQEQVTLFGGGAEIELKGGDITFKARGKFEVKAASVVFDGPGREIPLLGTLPFDKEKIKDWIEIERKYADGDPVQGAKFTVTYADGTQKSGRLNTEGFAHIDDVPKRGDVQITIGEDARPWVINDDAKDENIDNPAYKQKVTPEQAIELYKKVFGNQS